MYISNRSIKSLQKEFNIKSNDCQISYSYFYQIILRLVKRSIEQCICPICEYPNEFQNDIKKKHIELLNKFKIIKNSINNAIVIEVDYSEKLRYPFQSKTTQKEHYEYKELSLFGAVMKKNDSFQYFDIISENTIQNALHFYYCMKQLYQPWKDVFESNKRIIILSDNAMNIKNNYIFSKLSYIYHNTEFIYKVPFHGKSIIDGHFAVIKRGRLDYFNGRKHLRNAFDHLIYISTISNTICDELRKFENRKWKIMNRVKNIKKTRIWKKSFDDSINIKYGYMEKYNIS